MLVHYRIDNKHSNVYQLWQKMGSPQVAPMVLHCLMYLQIPTDDQFATLRENQELTVLEPPKPVNISDSSFQLEFSLPMPGFAFLCFQKETNSSHFRSQFDIPCCQTTGLNVLLFLSLMNCNRKDRGKSRT